MENNNWSFNSIQQQSTVDTSSVSKTFIASVFSWMGVALAISAVTAYVFGTDMSYLSYLINEATGKLNGLGYFVMFAPIGFVLLM
ncbi:MAG: BAX inhibitor (BI)-1/YccA family protein, partial [Bacteroidia bacterium]|nr:BAX inhibitor (BI)-1/YccA family protein [Bacteroidia bacterium]